jgi:hypothetical protein
MTTVTLALTAVLGATYPLHTGVAAPAHTSVDLPFDLAAQAGIKESFNFKITAPGCILAQIRPWTSSQQDGARADRLQLSLHGEDRANAYAFISGSPSAAAPLWISYAAFRPDVNRVNSWTITVMTVNNRGTARGVVRIEYPPTQMPCALRATTAGSQSYAANGNAGDSVNGGNSNRNGSSSSISSTTNITNANSVNLSWLYTGETFKGIFLIERSSNNGAAWRTVNGCSVAVSSRTSYNCTDPILASGDYLYRACAVTADVACSASNVTPALRVKVR